MRARLVVACVLVAGCVDAWAQPSRGIDAGVRARPRARDAGVDAARRRDASADVVMVRPATHGTIPPADVQRVVRGHATPVRECYERSLQRDPMLHGEIVVRLRVEDDGAVSETSSGGDPSLLAVGRCIEAVLRPVRFPAPTGGPATVAVPFRFQAAE